MLLKSTELKADTRFPSWITSHSIFNRYSSFEKIFPEIGLSNQSTEIQLDNSDEVKQSAQALVKDIYSAIETRLSSISRYAEVKTFGQKRQVKFETASKLLRDFRSSMTPKMVKKTIITTNGKTTLSLSKEIIGADGKVLFRAGEGLLKVYNKANDILRNGHFLAMPKFEEFASFKNFSSINIPKLKYRLVFSSAGLEGAWDIATMSMRGITSCQSWGQNNATHIVGSMIDPFTGILYLTSNAKYNQYGSRMIRRCIVRFVIGQKTKKPCLMLEKMYPGHDNSTAEAFIKFLREKTGDKYPVFLSGKNAAGPTYVPLAPSVAELTVYDQPYRDSAIQYLMDGKDPRTIRDETASLLSSFALKPSSNFWSSWSKMKMTDLPKEERPILRALKDIDGPYRYDVRTEIDSLVMEAISIASLKDVGRDPWKLAISQLTELKGKLETIITAQLKNFIRLSKQEASEQLLTTLVSKAVQHCSAFTDKEIAMLGQKSAKYCSSAAEEQEQPHIKFLTGGPRK